MCLSLSNKTIVSKYRRSKVEQTTKQRSKVTLANLKTDTIMEWSFTKSAYVAQTPGLEASKAFWRMISDH